MKTKFTIANKEEAKSILLNDSNVSQEDKDFLLTNPVYAKIVPMFQSNYDLILMSEEDFRKAFIRGNEKIDDLEYVSMVDHYERIPIFARILDKNYVEKVEEVKVSETYEEVKIDGNAICKYTFCLDGYGYARELKREAKEFGKFAKISKIDRGTMMGDCFDVIGTLNDIKEFHRVYDLDSRGIYFEEDTYCEEIS